MYTENITNTEPKQKGKINLRFLKKRAAQAITQITKSLKLKFALNTDNTSVRMRAQQKMSLTVTVSHAATIPTIHTFLINKLATAVMVCALVVT